MIKNILSDINVSRWRLFSILSLSFALSFMVFVHSPLEIYLNNPIIFVVGWRFLLPPLLLLFSISFVVISICLFLITQKNIFIGIAFFLLCCLAVVVSSVKIVLFQNYMFFFIAGIIVLGVLWYILTTKLKDNAGDVILIVLWSAVIASYIQVLFLNGQMHAITGAGQGTYEFAVLNLIIWILITLLPLGIWIFLRVKKIEFKFEKITVFSVIIIAGMQITGLVSGFITEDLPEGYDEGLPLFVSYESLLSLSPEKNIFVFILDKLDVRFMRETLETYPHLYDYLDGFTHYENNTPQYVDTLPSVVSMLTEVYYEEGLTVEEYWDIAWSNHSFIDVLRDNGYSTVLYLDYATTFKDFEQISGKTDNMRETDWIYIKGKNFTTINIRLSLGRMAPYIFKNSIFGSLDAAFANEMFGIVAANPNSIRPLVVNKNADETFYSFITRNRVLANNRKNVFLVMHMYCAHSVEEAVSDTETTLSMLYAYFNMMKDLEIYDKSTIILIADHGAPFPDVNGVPRNVPVTSSFFIKPENSRGRLVVETENELSNAYFSASILDIANLRRDDTAITYYDIIGGAPPPRLRYFYDYSNWWEALFENKNGGSMLFYGMYEITGGANPMDYINWHFIPNN